MIPRSCVKLSERASFDGRREKKNSNCFSFIFLFESDVFERVVTKLSPYLTVRLLDFSLLFATENVNRGLNMLFSGDLKSLLDCKSYKAPL